MSSCKRLRFSVLYAYVGGCGCCFFKIVLPSGYAYFDVSGFVVCTMLLSRCAKLPDSDSDAARDGKNALIMILIWCKGCSDSEFQSGENARILTLCNDGSGGRDWRGDDDYDTDADDDDEDTDDDADAEAHGDDGDRDDDNEDDDKFMVVMMTVMVVMTEMMVVIMVRMIMVAITVWW